MIALLTGLPRWAQALAGAAALIAAFLLWDWLDDRGVISDHEAKVAQQVEQKTTAANAAATSAADATRTEVEQTNDQARRAAAGSNDPLKSGLDGLRANQRPPRPAAP